MSTGVPTWIVSLMSYQKHVCVVGLITNSVHLIVLVQKDMRTTSINIILLGIAVSDLYYTGHPVTAYLITIVKNMTQICYSPESYLMVYLSWIAQCFRDDFARCTMLLGLSMAFIRLIVIRNPAQSDLLTSAKFGWKTVFLMFILSSTISFCYWLRSEIRNLADWSPSPRVCNLTNFPPNFTAKMYAIMPSELDLWTGQHFSRVYLFTDGLISKIIPAVLFPVFTVFLVCQLQKIAAARDRMFSDKKNEKSGLTSRLVIYNSISFMISGVPLGLLYVAQSFCETSVCSSFLANYTYLCTLFISANTISHFLICISVSSQYQKTVKRLLGIHTKFPASNTKMSVTS